MRSRHDGDNYPAASYLDGPRRLAWSSLGEPIQDESCRIGSGTRHGYWTGGRSIPGRRSPRRPASLPLRDFFLSRAKILCPIRHFLLTGSRNLAITRQPDNRTTTSSVSCWLPVGLTSSRCSRAATVRLSLEVLFFRSSESWASEGSTKTLASKGRDR